MLGGSVSPGIFTLSGGSSILTAINAAGGITKHGSFRKIEHKRNGKVLSVIDLI
jgi:protein involved in polysaccharide export with SLBB domain